MNAIPHEHRNVPAAIRPRGLARLAWAARCMPLSLWHWAVAARRGTPGVQLRGLCLHLAARLAVRGARIPATVLHMIAFWPFDSTRYVEFDFAWRRLQDMTTGRMLDVSSPRLLPLLIALDRPALSADLINPDVDDLALTTRLVAGAGLAQRVTTQAARVEDVNYGDGTFQAITCVSVLEHLRDPGPALRRMWAWLADGGRLVLTLPVAAQGVAQVGDADPYGVSGPDDTGAYFLQYLYDERMLRERIFSIIGEPTASTLYGEARPGALRDNLDRKANLARYPYWAEPTLMSDLLKPFVSLSTLPGEGVFCMEFVKHG